MFSRRHRVSRQMYMSCMMWFLGPFEVLLPTMWFRYRNMHVHSSTSTEIFALHHSLSKLFNYLNVTLVTWAISNPGAPCLSLPVICCGLPFLSSTGFWTTKRPGALSSESPNFSMLQTVWLNIDIKIMVLHLDMSTHIYPFCQYLNYTKHCKEQ